MGIFYLFKNQHSKDKSLERKFCFLKRVKYTLLDKPLTETEVKDFEELNSLILPDDYRYFLTHVGNGVCVLKEDLHPFSSKRTVEGLKTPEQNELYKFIPISYAGCTYRYCLILTGDHRGEVWLDNESNDLVPIKTTFVEFLKWVAKTKVY